MTHPDPLQNHRKLCDELYQLALEENRYLKEHGRAPAAELLERKRALLARLDESLEALKAASRAQPASPEAREAAEQAKARTMQFLHLDRENEQLLFRYSLASGPRPTLAAPPPSQLQRLYDRHP